MADQDGSRPFDADLDHSATTGNLVGRQLRPADFLGPVRAKATVRRAADRIFVDADPRRKEPRNQVVLSRARATGRDHAAHRILFESPEVRAQAADNFLALELDQKVEPILAGKLDSGAPSADCSSASSPGSEHRLSRRARTGNPARFRRGPAARSKGRCGSRKSGLVARKMPVFPEDMGRRQRGVAAQIDFAHGREPAQVEFRARRASAWRTPSRKDSFRPRQLASIFSSAGSESTQTAAGFPANGGSVKASTWLMRMPMRGSSFRFGGRGRRRVGVTAGGMWTRFTDARSLGGTLAMVCADTGRASRAESPDAFDPASESDPRVTDGARLGFAPTSDA